VYEFSERTIHLKIDHEKCKECSTKACVDGCAMFDRGILKLNDEGLPSVEHLSEDEVKRRGTECLACEYECWMRGLNALSIEVPIVGLDEYLKNRGRE